METKTNTAGPQQIPVILASATPALESLQMAESGIYRKLVLPARFGGAELPAIRTVNLTEERPERGRWLAPRMIEALRSLSLPGALEQVVESGGAIPSASIAVAAKTAAGDHPTAFVCIGTQCSAPIIDPDTLTKELHRARSASRGS